MTLGWLLLLGVLTLLFNDWLDSKRNPNQQVRLQNGVDGVPEIVLERNHQGHYFASGSINGQPVEFLLDTGATQVSVPASLAGTLGLRQGTAVSAETANGVIVVYATRLESIQLGDIVLQDIPATINPSMTGSAVLLGMSFLRHLEFTQRGNTLTLRKYQQ